MVSLACRRDTVLGYNSISGSLTLIEPRPDAGEVPRQQFMDPLDRMFCDTLQHLAQVVLGIETTQFSGFDQRVGHSRSLTTGIRTGEQPVLSIMSMCP